MCSPQSFEIAGAVELGHVFGGKSTHVEKGVSSAATAIACRKRRSMVELNRWQHARGTYYLLL